MIFNVLLSLILLTILFYLVVGGILWFHNRFQVVLEIKRRTSDNAWQRPGIDEEPVLTDDDIRKIIGESDNSTSSTTVQQLPGIFAKRIQKR